MAINTTSYLNTPQATNDLFTSATTGLTEDWLFVTYLAVMSNDLGGGAKTLYSIDNGTNSSDASSPTDLLAQDIVRTEALTTDRSANGAKIWITTDGKVGYDAATLSADFKDQLQQLTAGQFLTDTFTYAIRLGNGTLSWATATVQIAGANDAPVVTGAVTGNAEEDAPSVTLDALANASDVDAGATLSVLDIPASLPPGVSYDASTHSFTLDPSHPDFQHLAAGEHATVTVNYRVTDGTSTTAASASWNVVGTNDAPEVTGAVTGSATEDAPSVTLNALAHATDVDTGATLSVTNLPASLPPGVTWDAATQSFTLDPSDSAFQHLAAGEPMTVTVNYGVTDGTATTAASVAWNVVGTNDVPVITSNGGGATASLSVNENSSLVTTVTATDPDDGATQTYSIVGGTDAARFTIDASTGALSFVSAPNSEAPDDSNSDNVYDVTVRVSDGVSFDEQAIAVSVDDVNEFSVTTPVDGDVAANAVDENVAIDTVVGVTAFASDADATTNNVTYSLSSNPGGLFAIDAATGVVTTAVALDREALSASVSIEVTATSADTSTAVQTFSIAIDDVNEFSVTIPTDTSAAANAVDENVAIGTVVGVTAFASDADATTNTVTYSLSSNPGGLFAIDATTGVVTTAAAIDREALGAGVSIEVTAMSADGSSAAQSFEIAVNDVNEFSVTTPVDGNAAADAVDENVAIGTVVGVTAFASDADATTNTVTYSLSSNPGGLFAIDATTGVVTTAAPIDREALGAGVSIEVTATSADTSTAGQTFSVAINDVNEFSVTTPVDGNAAANAVDENVAIGTVVGVTAFAGDADATTNGVLYALSSNPGGLFAIDATTGVVTTAAAIDREALGAGATIEVTATSADTSTAVQTFGIAINGLNDNAPTITSNGGDSSVSVNVAEDSTTVTTVAATDADVPAQALTYSIAGGADLARFSIDPATGALSFIDTPNFESPADADANNVYDVVVRASDGTLFDDQALAVTVTNVNEAPVNSMPGAQTAVEDTPKVISGLGIADVDAGSGSLTLTLAVQHGSITVGAVGGGASVAGNNSASVTLSGTLTQINASLAALDNVSYKSAANYNGSDTLTMTTSDNGNAGSGGALTDIDSVAIVVNAANDAPAATNDVVYVSNNTNGVVVAASALLANDTDSDGLSLTMVSVGGATSGIQNLTLNANGNITFDSKNVGVNSFTYVVSDNAGGTSTGTVTVNTVSTNGGSTVDLHLANYQAAYLDGGSNGDALTGGTAADTFIGGAADDTLIGSAGSDSLRGGAGNDTIDGSAGSDMLDLSDASGALNFTLVQGSSATVVNLAGVGLGTDNYKNVEGVVGSAFADTLTGSSGGDVIRGASGNDTIDGAGGTDLLDFSDASGALNFTLVQGSGSTVVNLSGVGLGTDSYKNVEGVVGSAFADTLTGSSGADVLKGGNGNDIVTGGAGNDTLVGGSGADALTGGTGSDTFMVLKTDAAALDTITDFDATAGGDTLGIGDLLVGYSAVNAAQFVGLRESGSDTVVSIDRDGAGAAFGLQDLVVLQGVTGLDFSTLMAHVDPLSLP